MRQVRVAGVSFVGERWGLFAVRRENLAFLRSDQLRVNVFSLDYLLAGDLGYLHHIGGGGLRTLIPLALG